MKKTIVLSLLLVFILALTACADSQEETPAEEAPAEVPVEESPAEAPAEETAEPPAEEAATEMESGLAVVDSVIVTQDGGQAIATVSGFLPDSCTQISGISQSVEGSSINVTVETERPVDAVCAQALTAYEEAVAIDTSGLSDGEYSVVANGVTGDQPVVVGSSAASTDTAVDGSQITNIVWQWIDVVETDPAAQSVVPDPENYTITLHPDGGASIKADCNQVQVTYTLEGSSLVFNMLGPSTLAFCGEESLDTQFLSLLGSVNSWALESDQLIMSTSGGATMSFSNGGKAPGGVGIEPSQISLDTQGLPYSWQPVVVPAQPYDESMPPGPQGLPEHIEILFGVTDPADRQYGDPIMFIIPVASYEAMYEANDNASVTNSMNRIAELTYALPDPAPTSGYPALPPAPYSPVTGANDLAVQLGRAGADEFSATKNGYRFVGRWAQSPNPVTNENLFYTYQGFTNDGEYLVSFFYPVRTDQLPDDVSGVAQADMDAFNSDFQTHINEAAESLNQLSTSDWQPDLATLDLLVGSLQIEGMVASGIQETEWHWTSSAVDGSEEQPVDDPTAYTVYFNEDGTFHFQADCNSGGGSYTVEGGFNGDLSTQGGPMTLAACPPESRSDEYLSLLFAVQGYELRPGGLVLDMILPGGGTITFSEKGTADVELPEPETGEATGTVIAEAGANIRLGPGTGYPSIGVAPFGTTGTIIGVSQDSQWWAADVPSSPSNMGWVLASLVKAENVEDVPVIPAPALPAPPSTPTPVPPPSPTISFRADPTTIDEGDCSTLTWNVENIQAVWVYPQGENYQDYPVTGSGSQAACPTQTTTYEMRVQHTDGTFEFRHVAVNVQPSSSLANSSWVVSSLYVNQVPVPGSSLTAYYGSSGNFSANGGCNTYNGSYTVSGNNNISIGPLAGTVMSCGESLDGQEQAYLSALQSATTYVISGSQLILYDGSGQEAARFNRTG